MTAGWSVVVLLGAAACLGGFRQSDDGHGKAAPVPAPPPAITLAADAAPEVTPPADAPPKAVERLSARQCTEMRQNVERQLALAQRCKSDGDCEATTFEYAFRPCGISVRTGAKLDKVTADAKAYRERCNPVIRPVRCAHTPRAVCSKGRCALAPPEDKR